MSQVNKISIIGAGHIGESCAMLIALKQLANEVVMVDIIENLPQGKAIDMIQSSPLLGFETKIIGSNNFADIKNSDIIIMTAGYPRKPGMTFNDTIIQNAPIMQDVSEKIIEFAPDSIVIIVSYPLEAMIYVFEKVAKFPRNRIIGQAGLLDTARFISFVSEETQKPNKLIKSITIGYYEENTVPLTRLSTIEEKPINKIISDTQIDKLITQTQKSGNNISKLLGTSAYWAPAAATIAITESVINDKKNILPCCVLLIGEYGYKDIFLSVPVRLSRNGVDKIIEIELTLEEKSALDKVVEHTKNICKMVDGLGLF